MPIASTVAAPVSTFRGNLRAAAQRFLIAADTIAGNNVYLPRDWPLARDKLAISVQTPRWRHQDRSNAVGQPVFHSTVHLVVRCQTAAKGGAEGAATAENDIEIMADQVETAMGQFITGPPQLFRRLAEVVGELSIDSTGEQHIASVDLTFALEYSTRLEAAITDSLRRMAVTVDLESPFDANGTYPAYADPDFNAAVPPAPRSSGPDGRPEATLDISFP